jgi:peptidyl-prolyl cis-trans isomerase C
MAIIVNSEKIEDEIFQQERNRLRQRFAEAYESTQRQSAEEWIKNLARHNVISRVLLQQEAWRDPEPVASEAIVREVQLSRGNAQSTLCGEGDRRHAEGRVRLSRLFDRITKGVPRPTRKEIDLHYKTHRSQFVAPERVHVRQIIKNVDERTDHESARAAIEEAETELRTGAEFGSVADRFSDCAGNGGDLGWFPRGVMVEEFDNVVFHLEPGEISPIFETGFGFHIAQLLERRPAGPQPLSEIRDRLSAALYEERQAKLVARFVDELTARSEIREER